MKRNFILFVIVLIVLNACSKSGSTSTPAPPGGFVPDCSIVKTFAAEVAPIIASNCATTSCHASGSFNGPGALTTYAQIFSARSSIRSSVASGSMPKSGSLSAAQKSAIVCWIDAGAPNN